MLTTMAILIAIVAVFLILSILIQNPKGGGIDATMGGSANQMFGAARSADFIEKASWTLGGALLVLCVVTTLMLSGVASQQTGEDGQPQGAPIEIPEN